MSKDALIMSIEHVKSTIETLKNIVDSDSLAHLMLSQAADELEAILNEEV